jgi:hypothetical protein
MWLPASMRRSRPQVLHIAIQIANALTYLHPTVLHRCGLAGSILLLCCSSKMYL